MLPEFQGGSYDSWGGPGYADCYKLTGPDFENVFYDSNVAQGVTIQSNYMGVGGTDWGWLPAPFMYTSYDYGAAIRRPARSARPRTPALRALQVRREQADRRLHRGRAVTGQDDAGGTARLGTPPLSPRRPGPTPTTVPSSSTCAKPMPPRPPRTTTHLALNAASDRGYTYDDTDAGAPYSGTLVHANVVNANYTGGDYDQTESLERHRGRLELSVSFNGTAVRWIAPDRTTNGGIADVLLDGKQVATVDGYTRGKLSSRFCIQTTRPCRDPHR